MHRKSEPPARPAAHRPQPLDAPRCTHSPAPCDDCLALATAQALGLDEARPAAHWPDRTDDDRPELSPDPADAQHWAECNPDHHATAPTPVEALGDGPGAENPDAC